jgi:hypothetical protein
MNREELDREINEWLDRASAEYGRAKTRPGFEARVIADVRSRLEKKRWYFRWISIATATAAILVFSSYVLLTRFQEHGAKEIVLEKQREPERDLTYDAPPERPPMISQAKSSKGRHPGMHVHPKAGESEKTSFLSARLSDQERYLVYFVRAFSAQASAGIPEAEPGPLQTPDLEIPILQIPKAEISSIQIETVQLPIAHQSEDKL